MLLLASAILAALLALAATLLSFSSAVVLFIGGPILTILLVLIGVPLVVAPDEIRPSLHTRHHRQAVLAETEEGYGYGYGSPSYG